MPVASLSWILPAPTLPRISRFFLTTHSIRSCPSAASRLGPSPRPPPPASDQFPCLRLGPNGGPRQPHGPPGQPKTLAGCRGRWLCRCSAAGGKEKKLKSGARSNEDGDNNAEQRTRAARSGSVTAAAQILDPHYPRAPQKQPSRASVKEGWGGGEARRKGQVASRAL